MGTGATVLLTWHPAPAPVVAAHQERLREALAGRAHVRSAVVLDTGRDGTPTEPGCALTFDSAEDARRWLDSDDRAALAAAAQAEGVLRCRPETLVVGGERPPPGVALFDHPVSAGQDEDFVAAQRELLRRSGDFPGFDGGVLVRPDADTGWTSVVFFRSDAQLDGWLDSAERRELLPELRTHLHHDFAAVTRSNGFGTVVTIDGDATRVTPEWKTAMLVLLVLYPTVMVLSRFLGPVLDDVGAPPWLSMWLSQIVSVAAMAYAFMPWATGLFRGWLQPGTTRRTSMLGALVVVVVYIATLSLFASVKWLQFWDYID